MDPTFILLIVALGAFIVFQVFQGRKRRRETEERQTRFVPGVEIMTNYGLYGTILSIDDDKNLAMIETTPGTVLKIHRQTILKIADYDDVPAVEDESDAVEDDATPVSENRLTADGVIASTEPEFGERTEPGAPDLAARKGAAGKPLLSEPVVSEPIVSDSAVSQPAVSEPAASEPDSDQPAAAPVKKPVRRATKKIDE